MDTKRIDAIEALRVIHLEAQIVEELAQRTGSDIARAIELWYRSDLSKHVEHNDFGLQYLDASYLVDELLRHG